MGNIALITYDAPHRKTQDLLWQMMLNGYKNITLIALPFQERKQHKALYPHRPKLLNKFTPEDLCSRFSLKLLKCSPDELDSALYSYDCSIIGGAGIIPEKACIIHKIINSHPGYLPLSRGLDSLKWSIYHGLPIGVTTHIINDQPDEGFMIDRKILPVYFEDSFHSVCTRLYETEIEMLVDAIGKEGTMSLSSDGFQVYRRMPNHIENIMIDRFNKLRSKSRSIIS